MHPGTMAAAAATAADSYGDEAVLLLSSFYGQPRRGQPPLLDGEKLLADWEAWRPPLMAAARAEHARSLAAQEPVDVRAFWKVQISLLVGAQRQQLAALARIMLVLVPSSAEVERGFSVMNLIKTTNRARLCLVNLDILMRIAINGPASIEEFEFYLADVVRKWGRGVRVPSRSNHAPRPNRAKKHHFAEVTVCPITGVLLAI